MALSIGAFASPAATATLPCAPNLLPDGDFGTLAGTSTRALNPAPSGYSYANGALTSAGTYAVMSWGSSAQVHPSPAIWEGLAGHTTGADDDAYVGVNGSTRVGIFYSRTFTDLFPGLSYDAGVWATNAVQAPTPATTGLPQFGVRIIRTDTNAVVASATTGPLPSHVGTPGTRMGPSAWTQTSTAFVTDPNPNVDYRVEFYNISTQSSGNDFAFDDLTMSANVCPAMTVDKQAVTHDLDGNGIIDAGDTIDYSVVVRNTGDTAITSLTLTDAMLSTAGIDITCPVTTLAADASTTCTASGPYTITSTDAQAGSVDNTAQATAQTVDNRTMTDSDSVSVPVLVPAPALSLVKSSDVTDPATQYVAGRVVTYSFVVTNTGNVPVTAVSVVETEFSGGVRPQPSCPAAASSMAPGDQVTCTATYTLTTADIVATELTNTAQARGSGPGGVNVASSPSSYTIPAPPVARIDLVKSASRGSASAGDVVTYSFKLTNAGNVALSDANVVDFTFNGSEAVSPIDCPPGVLLPGEIKTCTASYTVTQDDFDAQTPIENTAHGTAIDPFGATLRSADSSASVAMNAAAPALKLEKTITSGASITAAGQTIHYLLSVVNEGDVTLFGISVADTMLTGAAGPVTLDCTGLAAELAPGEDSSCIGSYTVTQADIDAGTTAIRNGATATGATITSDRVDAPESTATATVTATTALTIDKSAATVDANGNGATDGGDQIRWSFLVTNTGTTTLTDVAVDDSTAGAVTCVATTLAPGASTACTADAPHVVSVADVSAGKVENTATATAATLFGLSTASDPDSVTVLVGDLALTGMSYSIVGASTAALLASGLIVLRRARRSRRRAR